ncbi:MAG: HRDC domain-containing protein [Sarcina sp.]
MIKKEITDEDLYNEITKYRYDKATEKRLPPYCIFNNITIEELVRERPKTEEALLKVKGFGKAKVEEFGTDIVELINGN